MKKPRILVTSAFGHTGAVCANQLLLQDFPVRAFVRRVDARSESLRRAGAEVFVGNLFDFEDLRRAMVGVKRAYHCPPFAPNALHGASLFALAAEEAKLEVVAQMTAWNPHAVHKSVFTRELWMIQNLARWMPSVDIIHINPGLFAFPYFFGLPTVQRLGLLMLPFGEGLNAPPANEDIGAIAAAVLARPAGHIGKSYRPTGPTLLSPEECARIMGKVLDRKVRYRDISTRLFTKAARSQGFSWFEIAQIRHFAEEVRGGTYAIGAPTDHVEQVCGRRPEDFETTTRRYLARPDLVYPGLQVPGLLGTLAQILRTVATPAPDLDRWEESRDTPRIEHSLLAHESPEWTVTAKRRRLALLPASREDLDSSASFSHAL